MAHSYMQLKLRGDPVSLDPKGTSDHGYVPTQRHAHNLKKQKDVTNTKQRNSIKIPKRKNANNSQRQIHEKSIRPLVSTVEDA